MKKKKLAVLSLLIALSICSIGYAQENPTSQSSDLEVFDLGNSLTAELENPKTGEIDEIQLKDCKKTVQTLSIDSYNDVVYFKDTLEGTADIPIDPSDDNNNVYTPMGGSSDYEYDDTYSVKATLTIEYTRSRDWEGNYAYLLTNAHGTWKVLDKNMTVYDKDFDVICKGYDSGHGQFDEDISVRDSKYSFDYDTDYTESVSESDKYGLVGAGMECYIERASDPWYFRFNNLIIDNGFDFPGV